MLLNVVDWLTFPKGLTVSSSCSTVFKSICRKIVDITILITNRNITRLVNCQYG